MPVLPGNAVRSVVRRQSSRWKEELDESADSTTIWFSSGSRRAGRIDEPSAWSHPLHGGLQNGQLTSLEIEEVLRFEAPFDLRITGESAGAGAWYVDEHAVKEFGGGQGADVGGDDLHILRGNQLAQAAGRGADAVPQPRWPLSGLRSASNRVLPPGAAQQSRMREPFPTSRATSCEASS